MTQPVDPMGKNRIGMLYEKSGWYICPFKNLGAIWLAIGNRALKREYIIGGGIDLPVPKFIPQLPLHVSKELRQLAKPTRKAPYGTWTDILKTFG